MNIAASVWRLLALMSMVGLILGLTGCANTQTPAYPAQLQMIIAQSATTADAPVQQDSPQAISVEQLLASVKQTEKSSATSAQRHSIVQTSNQHQITSNNEQKTIYGRDSVPDWIFKGESRTQLYMGSNPNANVHTNSSSDNDARMLAQALTQTHQKKPAKPPQTIKPNQRQLQLQYHANELLPHQMQLLMAKQMVALQQMRLVKLVIGASDESSSFARAATASRRAKLLIEQVSEQVNEQVSKQHTEQHTEQHSSQEKSQQDGVVVEYLPKIGDNIVIVTFQPRGR